MKRITYFVKLFWDSNKYFLFFFESKYFYVLRILYRTKIATKLKLRLTRIEIIRTKMTMFYIDNRSLLRCLHPQINIIKLVDLQISSYKFPYLNFWYYVNNMTISKCVNVKQSMRSIVTVYIGPYWWPRCFVNLLLITIASIDLMKIHPADRALSNLLRRILFYGLL